MINLVNTSLYSFNKTYDYQSVCDPEKDSKAAAGPRSVFVVRYWLTHKLSGSSSHSHSHTSTVYSFMHWKHPMQPWFYKLVGQKSVHKTKIILDSSRFNTGVILHYSHGKFWIRDWPFLLYSWIGVTLSSCLSAAYHCRLAQYWLVGFQCCLVSVLCCLCFVSVAFLCLCVCLRVGVRLYFEGRSLFGSGLAWCWRMELAGSVWDKGSYTTSHCLTTCVTFRLQYNQLLG